MSFLLEKVICHIVNDESMAPILAEQFDGSGIIRDGNRGSRLLRLHVNRYLNGELNDEMVDSVDQRDIKAAIKLICEVSKVVCPLVE